MGEKLLPLIDRPTPILDRIRGNPERKRPLLDYLAATDEELRDFRRSALSAAIAAVASSVVFATYGVTLMRRLPPLP